MHMCVKMQTLPQNNNAISLSFENVKWHFAHHNNFMISFLDMYRASEPAGERHLCRSWPKLYNFRFIYFFSNEIIYIFHVSLFTFCFYTFWNWMLKRLLATHLISAFTIEIYILKSKYFRLYTTNKHTTTTTLTAKEHTDREQQHFS